MSADSPHRDYRLDFDTRVRRLLQKARSANPLDGQAIMARDLERLCEAYLCPQGAEPGGLLGLIESHPNYVAGFKAGHAAGRKRAAPTESQS